MTELRFVTTIILYAVLLAMIARSESTKFDSEWRNTCDEAENVLRQKIKTAESLPRLKVK